MQVTVCHGTKHESDASRREDSVDCVRCLFRRYDRHEHRPPHGGTPIALGNEEYHLELVLDAAKTKLVAYILYGELEKFIRIAAPSFVIAVVVEGRDEVLTFEAVASNATGETVGDTSMFEVRADWLKADSTFDGILEELPVRSSKYSRVSFKFPKGNDAKP